MPDALIDYARQNTENPNQHEALMRELIQLLVPPIALQDSMDKWWIDTKVSEGFLDRLFEMYYERLGLPNLMRKRNFDALAHFVPNNKIDPEVTEKLDSIVEVAKRAKPRED